MFSSYAALHVHTTYSILDGHGKPEDYARRAEQLGIPAIGWSDHGTLSGAFSQWKASNKFGIKPILGIEAYIAPMGRSDKTPVQGFSGSGKYGHITLFAKDSTGLRNLFRMQAEAFKTGFYGKPRVDLELLSRYSPGLIATTGCAAGHVSTFVRTNRKEKAIQFASDLKDIFNEDLFIEVMNHGIKEDDLDEEWLNRELINLSEIMNIPLVHTLDAHYCNPEDHDIQQALLCVSTRDVLSNPKRFRFNGEGFYLKSRAEMDRLGLPQEALDNTVRIAEQVSSYDEVFAHSLRMPKFVIPEGWDEDAAEMDLVQWVP